MVTEADRRQIEELVRQHGRNFVKQDAGAQKGLFDADYPNLTYLPTEADDYLTSFGAISDYYDRVCTGFAPSDWRIDKLTVDFPSENVAFALCRVLVDYSILGNVSSGMLVPFHAPKGYWEGRCRYVFRRSPGGWKIIHYEDSTNENFRSGQLFDYHDRLVDEISQKLQGLKRPVPPEA